MFFFTSNFYNNKELCTFFPLYIYTWIKYAHGILPIRNNFPPNQLLASIDPRQLLTKHPHKLLFPMYLILINPEQKAIYALHQLMRKQKKCTTSGIHQLQQKQSWWMSSAAFEKSILAFPNNKNHSSQ